VFKSITLFVISLLVAPGLGLFASIHGMDVLHAESGAASFNEIWARCAAWGANAPEGCAMLERLRLLNRISWIALAVTVALPLFYLVAAWILGRNRDLLARLFPWLVRLVLGILPLVLVAHGILVWFGSWEMVEMGFIPGNVKLMLVLGGLGLMLVISAISILASIKRMLEPDSLHVTGILLEKQEMPQLFARVSRLAAKLGSREPERIIVGIEPTAYVANVPIKLRGVGDLPEAETLYLPTPALRVLSDAELDALIGHELGHFRGADVEFSTRFSPSLRNLAIAAEAVATEDSEEEGSMSLALLPAIGLLGFMLYTIRRIVGRISRQREFAADQASLEVSSPQAIATLLVKFNALSLQWQGFRHGLVALLHRGVSRQNLSVDYLARTRQFLSAAPADKLRNFLIEAHTPHPLDSHPPLIERAKAVGMDAGSVINSSLASLYDVRVPPAGLEAIEERISQIDADYYRHPTSPVAISNDPELPPELSFSQPT